MNDSIAGIYVYAMTRAFSLIILTVVNCPDSTADNIAKCPVRVLLRRCKYMQDA
jgi:hypothetical protein